MLGTLLGTTIELRPFTLDDVPAAHAVYSDPEVMRWVGRGAVSTPAATEGMLRQYIAHQDAHGFAFWAVVDRTSGRVIGDAGLARTIEGEVEMGYTLGRRWWGGGRATEAAGLWLDAAFRQLDIPRLRALVEAPNLGSRHVLEKLGFRQDGSTIAFDRVHLVYRLSRTTYAPKADRSDGLT
ncbi:MAG: GNAT family N-acetyltransferase [Solirubrobacteraceae bacterium]|nr:GNAT family N-acetyltransferase [Solirubrobacteraceae bacterium]